MEHTSTIPVSEVENTKDEEKYEAYITKCLNLAKKFRLQEDDIQSIIKFEDFKVQPRKYTCPSETYKILAYKHDKSEEEIKDIFKSEEYLLSKNQLHILYDNPTFGKYEFECTDEEISKIITKSAIDEYKKNPEYAEWWTVGDLRQEAEYYCRCMSIHFDSYAHVKTACINRFKRLLQHKHNRTKHYDHYEYLENLNNTYELEEDDSYIHIIENLNNNKLKELLIVSGYLIGNIHQLEEDYLEVLKNKPGDMRLEIQQLEKQQLAYEQNQYDTNMLTPISIEDIRDAMQIDISVNDLQKKFKNCCRKKKKEKRNPISKIPKAIEIIPEIIKYNWTKDEIENHLHKIKSNT